MLKQPSFTEGLAPPLRVEMQTAPGQRGQIGPNAVTRLAKALTREGLVNAVFERASVTHYLLVPPGEMVPESDVARLHSALLAVVGARKAVAIGRRAGILTAQYLLRNRIPRLAQQALRIMPAFLARRFLLKAIGGHAWTFAGSGRFEILQFSPPRLRISGGPLNLCASTDSLSAFYTATFEHLFRVLIDRRLRCHVEAPRGVGTVAFHIG